MKKIVAILFLSSVLSAAQQKVVTVYTYDSLASKHSFGKYLAVEFEKESGIKTELISFSTMAEAIGQLKLEGKKTKADILFGFDGLQLGQVEELGVMAKLPPELLHRPATEHRFNSEQAVAFDFGYLAFVFDSRRTSPSKEPVSFLTWAKDPKNKKKVIVQDPRTSSLGQSLLAWVGVLVPENEFLNFWTGFQPAFVTIAPGWSSAYGAFLKKECDFVLSYTTSPAYHVVEEKVDFYSSLSFTEGHFKQVEGVGIVKQSKNKTLAKKWLAFLLSDRIQTALPLKQWMYPSVAVTLPEAFQKLPPVKETTKLTKAAWATHRAEWTKQWTQALSHTP